MEVKSPKLKAIWSKANPPVIFRRGNSTPLLVRLPYASTNYVWLRSDKRHKPKWNKQYKCWEIPVAWYDWLADRMLKEYMAVYLIQLYREQQVCAPACWNAIGLHCECSCMGENHGNGYPDGKWREVSETFAFEWGPRKYACRRLSLSNES